MRFRASCAAAGCMRPAVCARVQAGPSSSPPRALCVPGGASCSAGGAGAGCRCARAQGRRSKRWSTKGPPLGLASRRATRRSERQRGTVRYGAGRCSACA
eukprot:scaffold1406_cov245-Prasinococcus_capsulatus_cf.AAC.1